MAGRGMRLTLDGGALLRSGGGAMAYETRPASIEHFSAGGSPKRFVATYFTGFLRKSLRKARLSWAKSSQKLSLKQYSKES